MVPHLGCTVDGLTIQQQQFAPRPLYGLCIALQTKGRPFVVEFLNCKEIEG